MTCCSGIARSARRSSGARRSSWKAWSTTCPRCTRCSMPPATPSAPARPAARCTRARTTPPGTPSVRPTLERRGRPMIDMHSHFFPMITREEAHKVEPARAPWLAVEPGASQGRIMLADRPFRPVYQALWDPDFRVGELDAQGIEMQVVCATPVMFGYAWEAKTAADWAARMNDKAIEFCAAHPKRLKPLSQVPLQDLQLACAEVSRAQRAGCVGVQIGNHVGDRDLDNEQLIDFLIHCAEQSIPVLVHPWDMMGGANRMRKWMLPWLVAMAAETQLGMLSLILSGAMERIPESLKICFAHGGGNFAFGIGRAHVLLGSDYPFPLGEQSIGSLVRGAEFLSAMQKQQIMHGNAAGFFNLQ